MFKHKINKKSGITLIALVVTIIVLLILAGISISMLSGDNSILQKATDAKTKSDEAQIKERIQLAYNSALTVGKGSYTKDTLMDELKNEFETDYDVDDTSNENWKLKAHGQEVIIPAGKKEKSKVEIKIGTTNLKNVSDLSTLYGEVTDYTSVQGIQWQLFYSDTNNIYLIASDYVPENTLPNELIANEQQSAYCRAFATYDNDTNSYVGTIMENSQWNSGADSSAITGNPQTNTYLKWVNSSLATTKNNPNMRAVAYMMDTNKWSNFAGNVDGAYAIGGPTLEMFALSYNSKHNDNQLGTYETITSDNAGTNGYNVKVGTGNWYFLASQGSLDTTLTDEKGNMWVITANNKADGMWISSPNNVANVLIYGVGNQGSIGAETINYYNAFRPVVTIPKSSIM